MQAVLTVTAISSLKQAVQPSPSWQATHNLRLKKMPLQGTSGAASYDAFGGGAPAALPTYIEDIFQTWLYTVDGTTTQAIQNGIDLTTYGGIVWEKMRSNVAGNAVTYQSAAKFLYTNSTAAAYNTGVTFTNNGYTMNSVYGPWSPTGATMASWTFRKQPKFFDVVTYTGTGSAQNITHSLGSVPACIIVKRTDTAGFDWPVYHRSTGNTDRLLLNDTVPSAASSGFWNNTTPTSSVFTVGGNVNTNGSGGTYVAYLFAHDAGGFGLTGTDNVISCGSFTRTFGTANSVNIGYEPQWVLIKCTSQTDSWQLYDTMRGLSQTESLKLEPNSSNSESNTAGMRPTATGFDIDATGVGGGTFIYIAIRRGPMKVPTTGTSVFTPVARTGTNVNFVYSTNPSVVDFIWQRQRNPASGGPPIDTNQANIYDRLRGKLQQIATASTDAEASYDGVSFASNSGYTVTYGSYVAINNSAYPEVYWNFSRAPSFADQVCFLGTGVAQNITHNLGAVPELIIVKNRTVAQAWSVYSATTGATQGLVLSATSAGNINSGYWNDTTPTSSVFTVGTLSRVNGTGANMVAYLFSTCAGVSKVGSFTGNGTTQAIACGFTGGARFVLIKRTDAVGGWYVYDTARGMTTLTDPYVFLNSTANEAATLGSVTTTTGGFTVNSAILADINVNAGTYIFLAIA
jgi:hypothetical protein